MKKQLVVLFLAFALVFALLPAAVLTASAKTYAGTCGKKLTWTLDTDSGMLEINGTGPMDDWDWPKDVPWDSFRDSIKTVSIGDGVTSIGDNAFCNCTSLTSITIPDSVTSIGKRAFFRCTGLTSVTVDAGNAYYCSMDGVLYNKDKTTLFYYPAAKAETTFVIPDGVTSIGDGAFYCCSGLTSVTIPVSVTSIGYLAFYGTGYYNDDTNWEDGVLYIGKYLICTRWISVSGDYTVKDGTKVIADYAFDLCEGLTSVTIPDSVTSIGNQAFSLCEGLTSVTIPDSVTSIGDFTFQGCTGLTSVTIGSGVTSIGEGVFRNCTGLTSVTIGSGVTSIGDWAFYICTGLTSVTIPDSVTSIGGCAFYECTGLTSVTIPDSVTSIGNGVLNNTGYYKDDANWEDGVLYNGKHLIDARKDTVPGDYAVKEGTKVIADYAFSSCTGLTSVTIPDGVTSIGRYAFYDCTSLTSMTIPGSVTSIGNSAFWACTGLTSLTLLGSVMNIGERAVGYYWNDETRAYEQIDGFTIYGYNGSSAQTYAEENGFAFVSLGDLPVEPEAAGDLNGDGDVDAVDSIRLAKYLVGLVELTDEQVAAADVNGDGDVTASDGIRLAKYLVGLVDTLRQEPA